MQEMVLLSPGAEMDLTEARGGDFLRRMRVYLIYIPRDAF
jgi:hypothetical protein